MADIPNKKYFKLTTYAASAPSYPQTSEEPVNPLNPEGIGNGGAPTPTPSLQEVTDVGNVTTRTIIHANAVNLNESATLQNVKDITGYRANLTTIDKTNLVQSINEVNAWDMEEW